MPAYGQNFGSLSVAEMVHVDSDAPVIPARLTLGIIRLCCFGAGALRMRACAPVMCAASFSSIGAGLAAILFSCGNRAGTVGMSAAVFGRFGGSLGHFVSPYQSFG